jgi:hypothetical protein
MHYTNEASLRLKQIYERFHFCSDLQICYSLEYFDGLCGLRFDYVKRIVYKIDFWSKFSSKSDLSCLHS